MQTACLLSCRDSRGGIITPNSKEFRSAGQALIFDDAREPGRCERVLTHRRCYTSLCRGQTMHSGISTRCTSGHSHRRHRVLRSSQRQNRVRKPCNNTGGIPVPHLSHSWARSAAQNKGPYSVNDDASDEGSTMVPLDPEDTSGDTFGPLVDNYPCTYHATMLRRPVSGGAACWIHGARNTAVQGNDDVH